MHLSNNLFENNLTKIMELKLVLIVLLQKKYDVALILCDLKYYFHSLIFWEFPFPISFCSEGIYISINSMSFILNFMIFL